MPKSVRNLIGRFSVADVFWLVGAGLVAAGAALERLSAGLIVAGILVLVLGVGSVTRAR